MGYFHEPPCYVVSPTVPVKVQHEIRLGTHGINWYCGLNVCEPYMTGIWGPFAKLYYIRLGHR